MPKKNLFISLLILNLALTTMPINGKEDQSLRINSINAELIESQSEDILLLKGNVVIKSDKFELWSDEATYDRRKEYIELKGNIKALSKTLSMSAEEMRADFLKEEFYLSESSFSFLEKGFGNASNISIRAEGAIELLNISMSSCKDEDLRWDLQAEKITILENRQNVIAENIKLEINEVPVFYIPYVRSAIGNEKFSGFLTPSIKQGKDGLDLSLPYFLSLAPNYDLTITPRYIQERGTVISKDARFLTNNSSGAISFSFMSKDRKFKDENQKSKKRWAGKIKTQSSFDSGLSFKVDSQHISDRFYFEDLDDDIIGSQQKDYITKSVSIDWSKNNLRIKGNLKKLENLNPFISDDYTVKPNFKLNYEKGIGSFKFKVLADHAKYTFEENYNPLKRHREVERDLFEPSISYNVQTNFSSFVIDLGTRKTDYEINLLSLDNSYDWAELNYKIFFDKTDLNSFNSISPMFKAIWVDGKNEFSDGIDSKLLNLNFDTLFSRNWYSGGDLFLDQNRFVIGLEYNHFNPSNNKERYISLGRAYFEDGEPNIGEFNLKDSSIVTEFKSDLIGNLKINSSLELDSNLKKISRGFIGFTYEDTTGKSFQLRSIYKRDIQYLYNSAIWNDDVESINQIELISHWKINEQWAIFGKILRDEEQSNSQDLSYGFQYSNCCLKVGLMKRKWVDQDFYTYTNSINNSPLLADDISDFERERDNLYVFFEMTELGRLGKKVSEVLTSKRFE